MTEKRSYQLLEQMLQSAVQGDEAQVLYLKSQYDARYSRLYKGGSAHLDYDKFIQSCVMSVRMPQLRKKFLADAKRRFSRISKPQY